MNRLNNFGEEEKSSRFIYVAGEERGYNGKNN